MTASKSLLLFGATGKTGLEVLRQALAAGHRVTAFARAPEKLARAAGLNVVRGDIAEPASIEAAFAEPFDAVLSVLGVFLKEPGTPLTNATIEIIGAMRRRNLKRLIVCSAMGVGDSRGCAPLWIRLPQSILFKNSLSDKTAQEDALRSSSLAWTILRPLQLLDEPGNGRYLRWEGLKPAHGKPSWRIPRADVAAEMLRVIDEPGTVRRAYQISG